MGLEAVALLDALLVVHDGIGEGAAGGQHPRVIVNQLEGVGVAGDDQRFQALFFRLLGQGAQHVVRFVAFRLDDGDAQGADDLLDAGHLGAHFVGHLDAVSFVLLVLLVAESLAHVEGHGDVVGLLVAQHVEQHGGEAEHCVGQLALGGSQTLRQGIVTTVGQSVTINEHQFTFGHSNLLSQPHCLRLYFTTLWPKVNRILPNIP